MQRFLTLPLILLAVVVLLGLWVMGSYNSLISQQLAVQTQQAQVEAQLQRRFDLVPNLVASVKGIMNQEQKVFKDIDDARTKYAGAPAGTPDKIAAANQYESALGRLLVITENYPELKSSQNVQDLMTQLEGTENRISVARQRYNETVQTYNQHLYTFPGNVIAGLLHFQPAVLFKSAPGAETAPKVNL